MAIYVDLVAILVGAWSKEIAVPPEVYLTHGYMLAARKDEFGVGVLVGKAFGWGV